MHIPVLQKEVLQMLDPKPNENFIDCTLGEAGHSLEILKRVAPQGKVLGIEWDKAAFDKIKPQERLVLVNDSYNNLKEIVENNNFKPVNGILFDLGMSSYQIDESGRGFTFSKDEKLDMRYSSDNELTAEHILNNYSAKEIEDILKEYGEERLAKKIAKRIIEQRPIKTTFDLKRLIPRATKPSRTFQALRIAVNDELNNLKRGLEQGAEVLEPGGRIAVISFHSLEDRIIKNFFKNNNKLQVLVKKPIMAAEQEIKNNYRSHSAKLRGAVKK